MAQLLKKIFFLSLQDILYFIKKYARTKYKIFYTLLIFLTLPSYFCMLNN